MDICMFRSFATSSPFPLPEHSDRVIGEESIASLLMSHHLSFWISSHSLSDREGAVSYCPWKLKNLSTKNFTHSLRNLLSLLMSPSSSCVLFCFYDPSFFPISIFFWSFQEAAFFLHSEISVSFARWLTYSCTVILRHETSLLMCLTGVTPLRLIFLPFSSRVSVSQMHFTSFASMKPVGIVSRKDY